MRKSYNKSLYGLTGIIKIFRMTITRRNTIDLNLRVEGTTVANCDAIARKTL